MELMERMTDMGIDPGQEDLKAMLASRGLQRQLMKFYQKTSATERMSQLGKVLERDVESIPVDETAMPEVLLCLALLLSTLLFMPLFLVDPAVQFKLLSGSPVQLAVLDISFLRSLYFAVGCCAPLLFETIQSPFASRRGRSVVVRISLMRNLVVFAVLLSSVLVLYLVNECSPATSVLPVSTYIVVRNWTYDVFVSTGCHYSLKYMPGLCLSRPALTFSFVVYKVANLIHCFSSLSGSLVLNWAYLPFQGVALAMYLVFYSRMLLLLRSRPSCSVVRTAIAFNSTFLFIFGTDYLMLGSDLTTREKNYTYGKTLAVVVLCKLALNLAGNYLVTTKARFREALGVGQSQGKGEVRGGVAAGGR